MKAIAQFGAVLALFGILISPSYAQERRPVWVLQVQGDRPLVNENRFPDPTFHKKFPVTSIRIRKLVDLTQREPDRPSPNLASVVFPLTISPDGSLSNPWKVTTWFPSSQLNRNEEFGMWSVLTRVPGNGQPLPRPPYSVTYVDLADITSQRVPLWELSPDGKAAVIHPQDETDPSNARTFFADPATGRIVGHYDAITTDAEFSRDGKRMAAVTHSGGESRIEILSLPLGELEAEGPTGGPYDQLHFDPRGTTLTFRTAPSLTQNQWYVMDVASHEVQTLSGLVWNSGQYYSGDGNTMLLVQPGGVDAATAHIGKAFLYDSSDPYQPTALWEFDADDIVHTASLNSDGSLVALNIGRNPYQTIVLDREKNLVATILQNHRMEGLQFEGDFLFVGVQRHPVPAEVHFMTTEQVRVYDLAALAGRE